MAPYEEMTMFAPYCKSHGSRVLMPVSSIYAIAKEGDSLVAWFSCTCGAVGTWRPDPRV